MFSVCLTLLTENYGTSQQDIERKRNAEKENHAHRFQAVAEVVQIYQTSKRRFHTGIDLFDIVESYNIDFPKING